MSDFFPMPLHSLYTLKHQSDSNSFLSHDDKTCSTLTRGRARVEMIPAKNHKDVYVCAKKCRKRDRYIPMLRTLYILASRIILDPLDTYLLRGNMGGRQDFSVWRGKYDDFRNLFAYVDWTEIRQWKF